MGILLLGSNDAAAREVAQMGVFPSAQVSRCQLELVNSTGCRRLKNRTAGLSRVCRQREGDDRDLRSNQGEDGESKVFETHSVNFRLLESDCVLV